MGMRIVSVLHILVTKGVTRQISPNPNQEPFVGTADVLRVICNTLILLAQFGIHLIIKLPQFTLGKGADTQRQHQYDGTKLFQWLLLIVKYLFLSID